jgi:hypothetical protein
MPDPDAIEQIHGSCHCGNMRFRFEWPEPGSPIPVRACGCDLCSKHKAVWTSHPNGRLSLAIADNAQINRYRFGTRTADFHVCKVCGVMPVTTCIISSRTFSVVNIHSFSEIDASRYVERKTDFEGETVASRLARRERTWTPVDLASSEFAW